MLLLDSDLLTNDPLREEVQDLLRKHGIQFSYPDSESILAAIHGLTTKAFIELIDDGFYDDQSWMLKRSITQDAFNLDAINCLLKRYLKPVLHLDNTINSNGLDDIYQSINEHLPKIIKLTEREASRLNTALESLISNKKLPKDAINFIHSHFVRLIKEYDIVVISPFRDVIEALDVDLSLVMGHEKIIDLINDQHHYICRYLRGDILNGAMINILNVHGAGPAIKIFKEGPSEDAKCLLTHTNVVNHLADYAKNQYATKEILEFIIGKCKFRQDDGYVTLTLNALCHHNMPGLLATNLISKLATNPTLIIGPEVSKINIVLSKYDIDKSILERFRRAAYETHGLQHAFGIVTDGSQSHAINRLGANSFKKLSLSIADKICDCIMSSDDILQSAFELSSGYEHTLSSEVMVKLSSHAIDTNNDLLMAAICDHYHLNKHSQEIILDKYLNSDVINTGHWPWIMHPFFANQKEVHADIFSRFLNTVELDHYSYSDSARALLSKNKVYLPSDEDGELEASALRANYTMESARDLLVAVTKLDSFEPEAIVAIGMKVINLLLLEKLREGKNIDLSAFDTALTEVVCAAPETDVSDYINLLGHEIRTLMNDDDSSLHKTSEFSPEFYESLVSAMLNEKMTDLSSQPEINIVRRLSL
jgi:hypothetical protein